MQNIQIFEQPILKGKKRVGTLAILRGGLGTDNPSAAMSAAVTQYVANSGLGYNEFVEIHLDNPWVRVIITGINEVAYHELRNQRLTV